MPRSSDSPRRPRKSERVSREGSKPFDPGRVSELLTDELSDEVFGDQSGSGGGGVGGPGGADRVEEVGAGEVERGQESFVGSAGPVVGLSAGEAGIADDRADRDVGNALISGVRDALRRMRECGADLETRRALLGDLDTEILVRLWAHHLAEEEQHAS